MLIFKLKHIWLIVNHFEIHKWPDNTFPKKKTLLVTIFSQNVARPFFFSEEANLTISTLFCQPHLVTLKGRQPQIFTWMVNNGIFWICFTHKMSSCRILYVSNNAGPKKVITPSCQPHLGHLIGCKPHEVPQNLNVDVFYAGFEIKL